jgi:hypothetical protein
MTYKGEFCFQTRLEMLGFPQEVKICDETYLRFTGTVEVVGSNFFCTVNGQSFVLHGEQLVFVRHGAEILWAEPISPEGLEV